MPSLKPQHDRMIKLYTDSLFPVPKVGKITTSATNCLSCCLPMKCGHRLMCSNP